jgi:hypothetical protein
MPCGASGIVSGGLLLDPYRDEVAYKKYQPKLQFLVVPGFGKVEITLRYESRHGGKLTKTVKLE